MTDQELQQLAQTITEALADDCHLPLCMVNEIEEVKFIPKFLKLLLRTHCIVSRSDVADWVKNASEFMPSSNLKVAMQIGAKRLFGTELFEERSGK